MIDTSEIITSKNHIEPLAEDGYIIYKLGYLSPVVDGKRAARMIWGNERRPNFQIQSDWNQEIDTEPDYIKNKPTLGTISAKDYWSGTLAAYTAITTKDSNTIYFIEE